MKWEETEGKRGQTSRSKRDIKRNRGVPSVQEDDQHGAHVHVRYRVGGGTESASLTIRFDTEKKTPTMGRPSKRAAQNPKAEATPSQSG